MSTYPLTLEEIVSWLRSREHALADSGATLAELRQRDEYLPAAFADFDSALAMGRISIWVNGCVDFEVLRLADSKHVFFRHEEILSISFPSLERAFADFVQQMKNPEERIVDA